MSITLRNLFSYCKKMRLIIKMSRSRMISIVKLIVIFLLSITPFIELIVRDGYFAIGDYVLPIFPDREIIKCISLWDESFLIGRLTTPIPLANLPQYIIYYIMHVLLGFENASRLLFPIVFIIAGFSMYTLSKYFVKNYTSNLASVTLYIYNPWIIDRILSGHISILIAYALTPLMLALYFKGIDEGRLKPILQSSLLLALIISISYHLAPLMILIILIYPLKLKGLRNILRTYKLTLIIIMLAMLLNSYWIITFPMVSESINSNVSINDIEALSIESNIVNVLRLHGYFWSGWWNVFKSGLPSIFTDLWWTLSFLPFIMLILSFKRVKLPLLIVIIYSILAVGLNWPFQPVNKFLYENIPFYTIYRDPNKMVSMICLAYSIATAYTIDWISRTKLRGLTIAIIVLLLINSWPLLTGNLYGYLQPFDFPREYMDVDHWLQDKSGNFRVLWLPPVEIGAEFSWRPKMKGLWSIIDPIRYSVFSKPSVGFTHVEEWFGGVRDTIWFLHFLHNQIYYRGFSELIPILNILNVKYIIFRRDVTASSCTNILRGEEDIWRVESELNKTFKLTHRIGCLRIYENPYVNPRDFTATNNSLIIVGDLEALTIIPNMEATFMIEDLSMEELNTILNLSNTTFVFLNTNIIDAAVHLAGDIYNPLSFLLNGWSPASYEWWKEGLNEIANRGCIHNGVIYSEEEGSTVIVNLNVREDGVYQLWVKTWLSPNPPSLKIYLDNSWLTDLNPYSPTSAFKYTPIQTIYLTSGIHNLKILLKQGKAILGNLVLVKLEEINQTILKLEGILSNPRVKTINIHKHEPLTISHYGVIELKTQTFKSGTYIVNVKANGVVGNVKMDFNNTIYNAEISNTLIKSIVKAGRGVNILKIYIEGNVTISHITVVEQGEVKIKNIEEPIVTKKSPLEYNIENISGNIIVFKQSYNPLWLAYSKETCKPIQSLIFNAYPAQKEMVIKLRIREAYIAGIIISIATLIAIITILSKPYGIRILRKVHLKTLSKG
ncbi:MAG: hypothetical protein QXP91_11500 [Candidatus Methanomethylicia archaeon]